MDDNIVAQVQELVADFKLEKALDLLITQAQTQNQRKQNALLVLKGKLALLEEQNLAGILDHGEVARQKAAIAHQILDIADGSSLDVELPDAGKNQQSVDTPIDSRKRMMIIAASFAMVVVAYFFIQWMDNRFTSNETPVEPNQEQTTQTTSDTKPTTDSPSDGPLKVLNFPKIKQPFNFLDFNLEFAWADAEWYSDTEIRLKIRYYMICKNNLGICSRPILRIYANDKPITHLEHTNTAIVIDNKTTATDDVSFVLPANTQDFYIEFSRDQSTWKRAFKILH